MDHSPNTFLIGVQKAGTSSFYDWLSQHPEIFAPEEMKDLHVFSSDEYYPKRKEMFSSFYKAYQEEKIILKGGVNYIYFPFVAERIFQFNPDAKLILILRNPVKRAVSAYNYFTNLGWETRTFSDALNQENPNGSIRDQAAFSYKDHGYYYKQIQNLLNYFKREQIKIVLFEDIKQDQTKVYNDVCEFLNVKKHLPDFNVKNDSRPAKHQWINRILLGKNPLKVLFRPFIPVRYRNSFGKSIRDMNKTTSKATMDYSAEYKLLKGVYQKDVDALSNFLNRDLKEVWPNV